jgi:hypothetical protein
VVVRGGRGRRQALGVGEPAQLGGDGGVFVRHRVGGFDLGETEAQDVGFPTAILGLRSQRRHRGDDVDPATVARAVVGEQPSDRLAAVTVDRIPLRCRRPKPQLVGLPVHRDEIVGEFTEDTDGHRPAAHLCLRPPVGTDHAAQQQCPVVDVAAEFADPPRHGRLGGQPDSPVDRSACRTNADERAVRACAEEQPEAGHHHGLPGAGLTSHHRQAGRELEHGVVDDAKPADPQLLEHARC